MPAVQEGEEKDDEEDTKSEQEESEELVSRCFESSQPHRVTSGLREREAEAETETDRQTKPAYNLR